MIRVVREEKTGRDLMDPHDWAVTVVKVHEECGVPLDDAATALDQAVAYVVAVAKRFEVTVEKIWPSAPVEKAWNVWRKNPLQYSKIAPDAGGYVDQIPMPRRATSLETIRTTELIQDAGFVVYRDAWHGQLGGSSIGIVKARLRMSRKASA
jgi:hypothetical protein